jgi:cell division protein FtsZ
MQGSGTALMGIGRASGEGRAIKAAQEAISSQLLESSINGASGVIINITGGSDMGIHEISDAASIIHDAVLDDATVIVGTAVNEAIKGEIQITVIATGIELKNNSSLSLFGSSSSSINNTKSDDLPQMQASDFFSGAFNTQTKSVLSNNSFTNIEIPDFLKR